MAIDDKVMLMPSDGENGVRAIADDGSMSLPRIVGKHFPITLKEISPERARELIGEISPEYYTRGSTVEFAAAGLIAGKGDVLYIGKGVAMAVASDIVESPRLFQKKLMETYGVPQRYYATVFLKP